MARNFQDNFNFYAKLRSDNIAVKYLIDHWNIFYFITVFAPFQSKRDHKALNIQRYMSA